MEKPWTVVGFFSNLTNKEFESFSFRSHAEQHAAWLRRTLGKQITIHVIWSRENEP